MYFKYYLDNYIIIICLSVYLYGSKWFISKRTKTVQICRAFKPNLYVRNIHDENLTSYWKYAFYRISGYHAYNKVSLPFWCVSQYIYTVYRYILCNRNQHVQKSIDKEIAANGRSEPRKKPMSDKDKEG